MRDYGKVSPKFWTGKTGKALRGHPEAQLVALYLMTCGHANMIGVFYLPRVFIAHDTGLTLEGASKGLARCLEAGFCTYDEDSETVFVTEMAAHQIGEEIAPRDNRLASVRKQYEGIEQSLIRQAFKARYGAVYGLADEGEKGKPLPSPLEAPPKPVAVTVEVEETEKKQDAALAALLDLAPKQVVSDFVKHRRAKKAPITLTAVDGIKREAAKAGITVESALRMCCERGWVGFKADWVGGSSAAAPARQRAKL